MNKTILLLGISVLLVILVLVLPDSDQKGKTVILQAISEPNRIHMEQDGRGFDLVKVDQEWIVRGRIEYPADQGRVSDLLKDFEKEKPAEWISGSETFSRFGLNDEAKVITTFYRDDKKLFNLSIGNSGNRNKSYYIQIEDDKNVYLTSGKRYVYDGDEKEMRDKKIFEFEENSVIDITVKKKGKTTILTRTESISPVTNQPNEVTWLDDKKRVYQKEEINDIVNTLSSLEVIDFEDDIIKDNLNNIDDLSQALGELVKVIANTKSGKFEINIHKKMDDNYYLATVPSGKTGYLISEMDGERLLKDLKEKK